MLADGVAFRSHHSTFDIPSTEPLPFLLQYYLLHCFLRSHHPRIQSSLIICFATTWNLICLMCFDGKLCYFLRWVVCRLGLAALIKRRGTIVGLHVISCWIVLFLIDCQRGLHFLGRILLHSAIFENFLDFFSDLVEHSISHDLFDTLVLSAALFGDMLGSFCFVDL